MEERLAAVTGGARGIGAEIAWDLARRGYTVAILDIDPSGADTAAEIEKGGLKALFYQCDLTSLEDVTKVVAAMQQDGSVIEILVNNAGWTSHEYFLNQDPKVWDKTVAINFTAVLNTCFAMGPYLAENGAIVNVASDAARIGVSQEAVYAGAKAAVVAFSKSLALEFARRGIRVNLVSPGSTLTPLLKEALSEEDVAKRVRATPLHRLGDPSDIAHAVTFLAIDATHITGQILSVNGGATRVG